MKRRIEAIKNYLNFYPHSFDAKTNLEVCECLNNLGLTFEDLGHSINPRKVHGYIELNSQIKCGNYYNLTNSTTNYEFNREDMLIIWSESCGRLYWVDSKYWFAVESEWQWLLDKLKSYSPLDYDDINSVFIYDVEQGKKLLNDYDEIMSELRDKFKQKISQLQRDEKLEQLAKLKAELEAD